MFTFVLENLSLNSIDKVKQFCNLSSFKCKGAVTVVSPAKPRDYVIDGKSIMGIFSLDLTKPVNVYFDNTNDLEVIRAEFMPD